MAIEAMFEKQGGVFLNSVKEITAKLKDVDCFVFDWDGVFNNGAKSDLKGSPFSEADSMGLNMLRFSYWLIHGKLPIVTIITGANNLTAIDFAKREHISAISINTKDKRVTLDQITKKYGTSHTKTAFVFDDILDLDASSICQLSFCVRRKASPLFNEFVSQKHMCDYLSANEGGQHAVREITELLIGLNGNYEETISKRIAYQGDYAQYLAERQAVEVEILNSDSIAYP